MSRNGDDVLEFCKAQLALYACDGLKMVIGE